MGLTWKDGATTILAVLILSIYCLKMYGYTIPFLSGYRIPVLLLGAIGLLMCAVGGNTAAGTQFFDMSRPLIAAASILSMISMVLVLVGVITGTSIAYTLLTMTIILTWFVSTVRHIAGW